MIAPALALAALASSAAPVVDASNAGLFTDLVAHALAAEPRFDVLSSGDMRRALEVEANKQALGCDASSTSCLAEIAGAMGAKVVVYGKLGALDDVVVLTLNVFDSAQGKSVGRVVARDSNLGALSGKVDGAVKELIAPFVATLAPGGKIKLLLLDIEAPGVNPSTSTASDAHGGAPWIGVGTIAGGLVAAGAGVVLIAIGSSYDKTADDISLAPATATKAYDTRDAFGEGGVAAVALGAVAVVAGGVLFALGE